MILRLKLRLTIPFLFILLSIIGCKTELEKKATKGDVYSQYQLGGFHFQKNPEKSFYWYNKAANQGHLKSQYMVSRMYRDGIGTEKNLKSYLIWLKKVAVSNNAKAAYELGMNYFEGIIIPKKILLAMNWLERSANQEHYDAAYQLAKIYDLGKDVTRDAVKALYWYQISANSRKSDVLNRIGQIYESDPDIPKDYYKSYCWYEEATLEKSPLGNYNLGMMILQGKGIKQDTLKAIKYLTYAAENKHAVAQYVLSKVCYDLKDRYPDNEGFKYGFQAFHWCQQSAEKGFVDSQFKLGLLYYNGKETLLDYKKAFQWFLKSAEQGYIKSYYYLGLLYAKGKGIKRNHKKAIYYFKICVKESNDLDALYELAMLEMQSTKKREFTENHVAITYLKSAARQGNIRAQYELADLYYQGKAFKKDYTKAFYWLEKAANQNMNFKNIRFIMAKMHIMGLGIDQDIETGLKYYRELAIIGDGKAQLALAKFYNQKGHKYTNREKAAYWMRKSYNSGNKYAKRLWNNLSLWKYEKENTTKEMDAMIERLKEENHSI